MYERRGWDVVLVGDMNMDSWRLVNREKRASSYDGEGE